VAALGQEQGHFGVDARCRGGNGKGRALQRGPGLAGYLPSEDYWFS
jgi:hypothetical protein